MWAERAVREAQAAPDSVAELAEARGIRSAAGAVGPAVGRRGDRRDAGPVRDGGSQREKAWAANTIGMCAYFAGRWDDARAYYEQAEEANRRIGHEYAAAVSAANRAEVLVQQGRADEALAVLDPALLVLVATKATSYISFALALYARAELLLGDYARALERLGEARALAIEMGETDEALGIAAVAVECLVRAGEPAEGLGFAGSVLASMSDAIGDASAAPALLRARGLALAALGRRDEAAAAIGQGLALAQERVTSFEIHECLSALLEIAAGDAGQAEVWSVERADLARQLGIVGQDQETVSVD